MWTVIWTSAARYRNYGRQDSPAFPPVLLLKALLYQVLLGHLSSSTWSREAQQSDPIKWLLFGGNVSRRRWYAFRDRIGPYLDETIAQVLAWAQSLGLNQAEECLVDGTFVAANASRHRMLNAKRLQARCRELEEATRGAIAVMRAGWGRGGCDPIGLRPALVQATPPSGHELKIFEIGSTQGLRPWYPE